MALQKGSDSVREQIIRWLKRRQMIPRKVLEHVASSLDAKGEFIRLNASELLAKQPDLSEELFEALMVRFKDQQEEDSVRIKAIDASLKRQTWHDDLVKFMAQWLTDRSESPTVREAVLKAVISLPKLSEKLFNAISTLFEDEQENPDLGSLKLLHLATNNHLTPYEKSLGIAMALVEDTGEHWDMRSRAVNVLQKAEMLPEDFLQRMLSRIEDEHEDQDLLQQFMSFVCCRSEFHKPLMRHIQMKLQLDKKDKKVLSLAIEILSYRSELSHQLVWAMVTRLEETYGDDDSKVYIVQALNDYARLPKGLLEAIMASIRENGRPGQPWGRFYSPTGGFTPMDMPKELLQLVAAGLDEENSKVQSEALETLGAQPQLSEELLLLVADRLSDEVHFVRRAAVRVLGKQSHLSKELLQLLRVRVEDKEWRVRLSTIIALEKHLRLSKELLQVAIDRLGDKHGIIREAALDVLLGQFQLSQETLKLVKARLEDPEAPVWQAAFGVLRKYGSFSQSLFDRPYTKVLHERLLRLSFKEDLAVYFDGDDLFVNTGTSITKVPSQDRPSDLRAVIEEVRPADMPPIVGEVGL